MIPIPKIPTQKTQVIQRIPLKTLMVTVGRKMKVIVPNVDENGNRVVLRPTTNAESMLERYKGAKNDNDVQILKNKQPKWNDQVGAYVLNFNGRVTRASVKNFQLCNVARDRERSATELLYRHSPPPLC